MLKIVALNLRNILYLCITKTKTAMTTSIEQNNTYKVIYSDGFTVMGYIIASNLPEAREIAKKRKNEWKTAYYKVVRCYNGGVRG